METPQPQRPGKIRDTGLTPRRVGTLLL
ncbi:rCG30593 [Rattus norvegicus]|uniref:RCG30593 n=1 Tax=Rattus norvegicus TaxID=10116 RepID=A6IUS0_RAT|nr:rCG30593 [Rattus norvegicus]